MAVSASHDRGSYVSALWAVVLELAPLVILATGGLAIYVLSGFDDENASGPVFWLYGLTIVMLFFALLISGVGWGVAGYPVVGAAVFLGKFLVPYSLWWLPPDCYPERCTLFESDGGHTGGNQLGLSFILFIFWPAISATALAVWLLLQRLGSPRRIREDSTT
jgi:hypothetical protein